MHNNLINYIQKEDIQGLEQALQNGASPNIMYHYDYKNNNGDKHFFPEGENYGMSLDTPLKYLLTHSFSNPIKLEIIKILQKYGADINPITINFLLTLSHINNRINEKIVDFTDLDLFIRLLGVKFNKIGFTKTILQNFNDACKKLIIPTEENKKLEFINQEVKLISQFFIALSEIKVEQ